MDLFNAKYKINEKVNYCLKEANNQELIGIVIDAKLHPDLGILYLVKYEDGSELWAFEDSLSKGE